MIPQSKKASLEEMLQRLKADSKKPIRATPFVAFAIAVSLCGVGDIYLRSVDAMPAKEFIVVRAMVEQVAADRRVRPATIWREVMLARGASAPFALLRRDYDPALDMLVSQVSPRPPTK